jgi:hypothetical protein
MDSPLFFDRVDSNNVRVIQGCYSTSFSLEAIQPIRIRRHRRWQYFESHLATEVSILRQKHFSHPALAELG